MQSFQNLCVTITIMVQIADFQIFSHHPFFFVTAFHSHFLTGGIALCCNNLDSHNVRQGLGNKRFQKIYRIG